MVTSGLDVFNELSIDHTGTRIQVMGNEYEYVSVIFRDRSVIIPSLVEQDEVSKLNFLWGIVCDNAFLYLDVNEVLSDVEQFAVDRVCVLMDLLGEDEYRVLSDFVFDEVN